ncbi:LAFA_0F07844g1_1 [Lachancea sp. 'fantastica']|nr:LAFA_0F07844g1_1 [Lachancea sp. 'fantastica']
MSQDAYYITPNETALAVVATSMKKSRMRLETLICNSIMGGVFFSTGGMLFTACHASNPGIFERNPGLLDFLGGLMFPIGLFYVVINGADLFNSNILFFMVGVLQGAVSIYDLLISWVVSWFGNLGGTLFVMYVICHLSSVTSSPNFVKWTHILVAEKDSFNFIKTFIKAIAGNFYVCLAIYLQMMAKPIHVKLLMLVLPIFSFVGMGFTHVVADMFMLTIGMINGADLSVSRFIWKHMVAATLGNIVGGGAFAAIVPFYMHLVTVENDRKRLSLPEQEVRDEQPELNVDSRVVRIPTKVAEEMDEEAEEGEEDIERENHTEKNDFEFASSDSSIADASNGKNPPVEYRPAMRNSSSNFSRMSTALKKTSTNRSTTSMRSNSSIPQRTPAGLFPVKGMASPRLSGYQRTSSQERGLNGTFSARPSHSKSNGSNLLRRLRTSTSDQIAPTVQRRPSLRQTLTTCSLGHMQPPTNSGAPENVMETKMGARLERAITRLGSRFSRDEKDLLSRLPISTQELHPISSSSAPDTMDYGGANPKTMINSPLDHAATPDVSDLLRSHSQGDGEGELPQGYRSRNVSTASGPSLPRRPSSAYLTEATGPRRALPGKTS